MLLGITHFQFQADFPQKLCPGGIKCFLYPIDALYCIDMEQN